MTPAELKHARLTLGLTQKQMAAMLDIKGSQEVARMEADPSCSKARSAPVRVERLIRLYIAGARPHDWPT